MGDERREFLRGPGRVLCGCSASAESWRTGSLSRGAMETALDRGRAGPRMQQGKGIAL